MLNGKVQIAVLISGGGTNLQALLDFEKAGNLKSGSIALVISDNAAAYGLSRAENAGVKALVIKPSADKSISRSERNAAFEAELQKTLENYNIDMIVLAGFMRILSADFVRPWEGRMINIHPSLIPSFCGPGFYGLHVHEAALEYGVKVSGATVHYVNAVPDGGKIIFQKAVNIEEGDTPEILQKRVMEQAEWILLPRAAEFVAAKIAEEKK